MKTRSVNKFVYTEDVLAFTGMTQDELASEVKKALERYRDKGAGRFINLIMEDEMLTLCTMKRNLQLNSNLRLVGACECVGRTAGNRDGVMVSLF